MQNSDTIAYISLFLAILFWILSSKQASDAKKTLSDIKSEIIAWQTKLNEASINIISSRPEIIAKETSIRESEALSDFSSRLTGLIEGIALNQNKTEADKDNQTEILRQLLEHHKALILGKQQLMNQAIAYQAGHRPEAPIQKDKTSDEK